jgi:hypothetical protein
MSICIDIQDLILSKRLLYLALSNCSHYEFSKTCGPLAVKQVGNKYKLVDGYHRLVKLMLFLEIKVNCVPSEKDLDIEDDDLFVHKPQNKFRGLEVFSDVNYLEDVLCHLNQTR